MIDKEEFLENVKTIKRNLIIIESLEIKTIDNLKEDIKNYYTLSMALFTIFNKLIDIGDDIVSELNIGYINKYTDIPKILSENNIISSQSRNIFIDFIKSRNDIAHEYDEIREEEVFWCFKNIDKVTIILEEFKKVQQFE